MQNSSNVGSMGGPPNLPAQDGLIKPLGFHPLNLIDFRGCIRHFPGNSIFLASDSGAKSPLTADRDRFAPDKHHNEFCNRSARADKDSGF